MPFSIFAFPVLPKERHTHTNAHKEKMTTLTGFDVTEIWIGPDKFMKPSFPSPYTHTKHITNNKSSVVFPYATQTHLSVAFCFLFFFPLSLLLVSLTRLKRHIFTNTNTNTMKAQGKR